MGVCYEISCLDCRVRRDLDKMMIHGPAVSQSEVISAEKGISRDSYRVSLLVTFLFEHIGHRVVFVPDCGDVELSGFPDEGRDYW
jgi:hypothetical protein